jgi:uncharacterized protein
MAAGQGADARHLPRSALIDAYGDGGFRFDGSMSHRGSLLCLPDGVWAWPVKDATEITAAVLELVFARGEVLDVFLIGTGRDPWPIPERLRDCFRALGVSLDAMPTGPAVRTYNILLAENRRVGAGLIAVD